MKKLIIFIYIFLIVALASLPANALGTSAGTTINNLTTDINIDFTGPTNVTFNVSASAQITHTVLGVNGFNFTDFGNVILSSPNYNQILTNAGVLNGAREPIFNLSNQPVTISFQTIGAVRSVSGNPGTLNNWNFNFSNSTLGLTQDTTTDNFVPNVTPASDAQDLSAAAISLNITIVGTNPATPNQQYTGFNDVLYAGYTSYEYEMTGYIFAPLLTIVTRSAEVIAPTVNGYAGADAAVVPGSKIIYTLVIQNIGSDTAATVNVSDFVPQESSNVEYLVNSANGTGSPVMSFYDPNNAMTPAGTVDSNVKKINWQLLLIPSGESRTLNYTVVVK
jgi:uncharacterized repeat protein (TIGR01451 family)